MDVILTYTVDYIPATYIRGFNTHKHFFIQASEKDIIAVQGYIPAGQKHQEYVDFFLITLKLDAQTDLPKNRTV